MNGMLIPPKLTSHFDVKNLLILKHNLKIRYIIEIHIHIIINI